MLARLWWKEARLFWPIWAFLVLVAGAAQWLALRYFDVEARHGFLFAGALGLAAIYGFAVAAAAFAGERENGTLLLLDTLAIDRWVLWRCKFSFALTSTLALAIVLLGLAALGTGRPGATMFPGTVATIVLFGCGLLFEAIGWGLFWSSLSSTALGAAVLAIFSVVLITPLTMVQADRHSHGLPYPAFWRLVLAVAATIASAMVMTWRQQQAAGIGQWPVAVVDSFEHTGAARREWTPAARRLLWQAIRQDRAAVLALGAIGLLLALEARRATPMLLLFSAIAGLTMGVNVFGVENRGRTQRFLTNHGARPLLVWAVKLAAGAIGLLLVFAPLALVLALAELRLRGLRDMPYFGAVVANIFAVSLLCGMTIRRGITAWVVALVASLVVLAPQAFLFDVGMLPVWGLAATPLALLAVTGAWSADWLLDRPGLGRWARLGALALGAIGLLLGTFAGYRVVSVLGVAAAAGLEAGPPPSPIVPDGLNAAPLYLEARRRWRPPAATEDPQVGPGSGAEAASRSRWLRGNAEVLDLVRSASAMLLCEFDRPGRATLFSPPTVPHLQPLAELLAGDCRERQARGDLAGAWDTIEVLLRMARHLAQNAPIAQRRQAERIQQDAVRLAMGWAADPGQSPERLRAALDAFRRLPPMPHLSETIEAEWRLAEQTLTSSVGDLQAGLSTLVPSSEMRPFGNHLFLDCATTPWEIARARRVFRVLFPAQRAEAVLEPWRRRRSPRRAGQWIDVLLTHGGPASRLSAQDLDWLQKSTPLVNWLMPSLNSILENADRGEVGFRALPQVLALRSWQLRHDGRFPERLADLVPEELDRLPADPYRDGSEPFGYTRAKGPPRQPYLIEPSALFPPLRLGGAIELQGYFASIGRRLLYSVGRDGRDSQANQTKDQWAPLDDLVIPLPLEEDPAGKTPGRTDGGPVQEPRPPPGKGSGAGGRSGRRAGRRSGRPRR